MSIAIMSEVWKHAPVASTELLMLLALADMANEDRECWPSVRHLMYKARVSEPQARRLLKSLERQNLIEIAVNGGKGIEGRKSNLYLITTMDAWAIADDTPIADDTSTPIADDTSTPIARDTLNHHSEPSSKETTNTANKSRVVFEAIAQHVFGITNLKGLSKGSAGRIGKLEKIARQLITARDPAATDELIARRVASFASAETFKAGIQGTTGFELKFAAYLEVTHTMNKPRLEAEPDDEEHLITPEQMAQARELFNQMVKQHDANSRPRQ